MMEHATAPLAPERLFSLKGRVALVTGSSRGIGWAIAQSLAAAGAHVVLASRDAVQLESRLAELTGHGLDASFLRFDVSDHSAAKEAVGHVVRGRGGIDILVNNAGMAMPRVSSTDVELADFRKTLQANLESCFVLSREAARAMVRRRWGRIINISSILGSGSRRGALAYTVSKHALDGLTRVFAADLGEHGVTCNSIAPGFVATTLNARSLNDSEIKRNIAEHTAVGRWGEPQDIAGAAVFLASETASFVTGQVLVVDGGMSCGYWV